MKDISSTHWKTSVRPDATPTSIPTEAWVQTPPLTKGNSLGGAIIPDNAQGPPSSSMDITVETAPSSTSLSSTRQGRFEERRMLSLIRRLFWPGKQQGGGTPFPLHRGPTKTTSPPPPPLTSPPEISVSTSILTSIVTVDHTSSTSVSTSSATQATTTSADPSTTPQSESTTPSPSTTSTGSTTLDSVSSSLEASSDTSVSTSLGSTPESDSLSPNSVASSQPTLSLQSPFSQVVSGASPTSTSGGISTPSSPHLAAIILGTLFGTLLVLLLVFGLLYIRRRRRHNNPTASSISFHRDRMIRRWYSSAASSISGMSGKLGSWNSNSEVSEKDDSDVVSLTPSDSVSQLMSAHPMKKSKPLAPSTTLSTLHEMDAPSESGGDPGTFEYKDLPPLPALYPATIPTINLIPATPRSSGVVAQKLEYNSFRRST